MSFGACRARGLLEAEARLPHRVRITPPRSGMETSNGINHRVYFAVPYTMSDFAAAISG